MRRRLFTFFGSVGLALPMFARAQGHGRGAGGDDRFDRIGIVLVVDAVAGAELRGVKFHDDAGTEIYAKAIQNRANRFIGSFGGSRVPRSVRVTWKDHPTTVWGANGGLDFEGPILGDHTVPVGPRIPDAVLTDIRAHGGSLRLKFRLKTDGVLFAWDIERPGGGVSRFDMPGGDFPDTTY